MTQAGRRQSIKALMLGSLAAAGPAAMAATDRPLRTILPVGPGSGIDMIVRAAVPALSRALNGQPVMVDNVVGAGGTIGTLALIRAPADGLTVGVVSNNLVLTPLLQPKAPFDPFNDVTPICMVGTSPFVLVVNPARLPAGNARELQALLKARPGVFNYASTGNGSIIQLASAMYLDAADVDVRHVPYKAIGSMVTDLIGGQVEMGVLALPVAQPHIKSGALRAIGLTGSRRVPSLPDLPTIAEQGFAQVDVDGWFAFIGPHGLPADRVRLLHEAVVAAFAAPETMAAMARQQNLINPLSPAASAEFFRSETARYAAVVRKAGITLD